MVRKRAALIIVVLVMVLIFAEWPTRGVSAAPPSKKTPVPIGTITPMPEVFPTATRAPRVSPTATAVGGATPPYTYGVIQSNPQYVTSDYAAGLRLRTLELSWDRYEPQEGTWDNGYIEAKRAEYQQMIAAGFRVALDTGVVYPPTWIWDYPNSRFINQYGDAFVARELGGNGVNAIFNQTIRDKQACYVKQIFNDFGTGFAMVRLGWGRFGEVNYPVSGFNGHTNSYWAFDTIAQGRAAGLPAGLTPDPVPGWVPGTSSVNHAAASTFVNWYLDSLRNYHDWQIATVRGFYSGKLIMLYADWVLRPGHLDGAIAADLNGSTLVEVNGNVQAGFDYARMIPRITDPNVIVCTTWLDADDRYDAGTEQTLWSPVHYLAVVASTNPLKLQMWGENTGRGNLPAMQLSFQQMRKYGLGGITWAFNPDLYSGQYATINEYATLIAQYR